jgi:hypothetical protein
LWRELTLASRFRKPFPFPSRTRNNSLLLLDDKRQCQTGCQLLVLQFYDFMSCSQCLRCCEHLPRSLPPPSFSALCTSREDVAPSHARVRPIIVLPAESDCACNSARCCLICAFVSRSMSQILPFLRSAASGSTKAGHVPAKI